jgi:outer membrane murein-binding lipoprotein Lpp
VRDAAKRLQERGQKVGTRAVHRLLGTGSFRDIQRILRDEAFLDDDEGDELGAEALEPVRPLVGKITQTLESAKAAEAEAGRASGALDVKLEQLRDLQAHRPPPAVDPDAVADSVSLRFQHEAEVATLVAEVNQLRSITEAHQAEARALRVEAQKLQHRGHELREYLIPGARRDLADAQAGLTVAEQEWAHRVQLARKRIAIQEAAVRVFERELVELRGG